jgi:sulfur carrier protein
MMNITLNGASQEFADEILTISEILTRNAVQKVELVTVQLNGEFVDPSDFIRTFVKNDDEVDFLYFLGGGSGR